MSPILVVLFLVVGIVTPLVNAAGRTEVKCNVTSVVSWSYNQESQSPCQVAANLAAVCSTTGTYDISPLNPVFGRYYTPSAVATPCECSSVVYTLAAACGLCQGASYTNWITWTTNCTSPSAGSYPFSIPPNTFIPKWAFMDVKSSNNFNPSLAQSIGDAPESSASATPVKTSSTKPPATSVTHTAAGTNTRTAASAPTSSTKSSTKSSSNHAGAIAGGVVGGVVGFALIAGLAFFLLRRSQKRRISVISPPIMQTDEKDYSISSPYLSSQHVDNHPNTSYVNTSYVNNNLGTPHKSYDPNDPSTFPHSPAQQGQLAPSHLTSGNPSGYGDGRGPNFPNPQAHPGGYSGVAEI